MRSKRIAALALAVAVILMDRLTKIDIEQMLSPFDNIPIIPGFLRIVHIENPGAAFGVLSEGNPTVRGFVLIGVSALVMCLVVAALWMRSVTEGLTVNHLSLGAILGGAGGNLYDRVVHGTVTDFIEVFHGSWTFPAFNVADSAITTGAAVLLLHTLLRPKHPGHERPAPVLEIGPRDR